MAIAKTLDLVREHRNEYEAAEAPRFVTVGPARFLALDGKGEPGGEAFRADVAALFGVAESVRKHLRKGGRDFKIAHLEALWWMPRRKGGPFHWRVLLRVPGFVTEREVREVGAHVAHRGKRPAADVRLETLDEGECIQTLHRGPYDAVVAAVARLAAAAAAAGRSMAPPVHEIYLNDPAEVGPARAETIVRHPLSAGAARASAGPRGRDRLPGTIRTLRLAKKPQHRARELR
jgi:hypothetical protein